MKLLFPNGEHAQVLLAQGRQVLGSGEDAIIRLQDENILEAHAELVREGEEVMLRALSDEAAICVNAEKLEMGREAHLQNGDVLQFGTISARLEGMVKVEAGSGTPPPPSAPPPAPVEEDDDLGATRVRMAVPRFVLRGVSGAAFGKTYAIPRSQLIGRQSDCDITIASNEISRHHARVTPTPVGLRIEDLDSSNGTYINGKRVQEGLLMPGEELRLDNIRFLLVAPGAEIPTVSRLSAEARPTPRRRSTAAWVVTTLLVLAAAGAGVWWYLS